MAEQTASITPDLVIDTSGSYCPVPIIETAKALKTMQPGRIVLVIATDPGVDPDMRAWCKATKNDLLDLTRRGDVWRCLVRKRG